MMARKTDSLYPRAVDFFQPQNFKKTRKITKSLKSLIGRALAVGPELTRLTGLPGLPELTGLPRLTGLTELTGLAGLIQAGPQAACVGGHTRRTIFFCTPLRQNDQQIPALKICTPPQAF